MRLAMGRAGCLACLCGGVGGVGQDADLQTEE